MPKITPNTFPGGYRGRLEYPIDKDNQYNTKIQFQAVQVEPPTVVPLGGKESKTAVGPPGASGPIDRNTADTVGLQSSGNLKFFSIKGERADLYVPLGGFQVNDGFDYAQSSLGVVGAAGAAALNATGSISQAGAKAAAELGQSFVDLFNLTAGSGQVGRLAALRASQLAPIGQNLRNAAQITTRVTLNPNIRTNFNGVGPREFNFQFQFFPTSSRESAAVQAIIKFFRFHAYPDVIAGFPKAQAFSVGFDYPDLFKIQLLTGVKGKFERIGTPIKLSYLKAISTTYNPTSPALHADGSPTEITMGLTFVEYKAQTRQDIINEDNNSFYHFENGQDISGTINSKLGGLPSTPSLGRSALDEFLQG